MRILDLFCGGGGAGMGYSRAGFDVVGVDKERQPNYPFSFVQMDALEYVRQLTPAQLGSFDAIHASPPCQLYTSKPDHWGRQRKHYVEHPDLIDPTRQLLVDTGLPWVLENVEGAPVDAGVLLCGTMFGLKIVKHRLFEASFQLPPAPAFCDHIDVYTPWRGKGRSAAKLREAMGIDWLAISGGASRKKGVTGDLFNAIPPKYTEWLGRLLRDAILDQMLAQIPRWRA